MKLQTKIILITLMVFIISFSFLGILIFSNSKINLENQMEYKLISLAQISKNNINTFLEGQKNKIELVATQDELTNEELKEMVGLDDSFYDMFVIDSSGRVIVSSNPERIGLDRSNRSYFFNARNQTYIGSVYFALVPKEYSISISTPFNGGVLVGSIKLDILNKIISDRTGLGKSEERLLAFINEQEELVYFTQRLGSEELIQKLPKEQATSLPIYHAVSGEENLYKGLKDYRGIKVISYTSYIEELKIGMVTKIDIEEALLDINRLQKITIFLIFIIIILTSFILYIIAKQISREIINISEDIDKITKGNLGIQLRKSSIFEIQNLINSLNRILASMKLAILRTGVSKGEIGIGEAVMAKEEAEDKYKMLFDNTNDAIFIHDLEGHFLEVNQTACKRLGYTKAEFLKLNPQKIDSPKYAKLVKSRVEELKKKGSVIFNSVHITKSGKEIPVEISSKVITYLGAPAILSLAREKIK